MRAIASICAASICRVTICDTPCALVVAWTGHAWRAQYSTKRGSKASLAKTNLMAAQIIPVQMQGAKFSGTTSKLLSLPGQGCRMAGISFAFSAPSQRECATLRGANLEAARLFGARLERADTFRVIARISELSGGRMTMRTKLHVVETAGAAIARRENLRRSGRSADPVRAKGASIRPGRVTLGPRPCLNRPKAFRSAPPSAPYPVEADHIPAWHHIAAVSRLRANSLA